MIGLGDVYGYGYWYVVGDGDVIGVDFVGGCCC